MHHFACYNVHQFAIRVLFRTQRIYSQCKGPPYALMTLVICIESACHLFFLCIPTRKLAFVMSLRLVLTSPQMAKLRAHFVIWTPFTSCTSWSMAEAHISWLDELICKYGVVNSWDKTHCTVIFQFIKAFCWISYNVHRISHTSGSYDIQLRRNRATWPLQMPAEG